MGLGFVLSAVSCKIVQYEIPVIFCSFIGSALRLRQKARAGMEKTAVGMYPTLEVTDSAVAYDPGIGDTCRWFRSYCFSDDSLFLMYDGKNASRCEVVELHDSVLVVRGLLWHGEKAVAFVRTKD